MSATLYAYQGKEFVETAVFLDFTGNPINVTGYTSYLKVAKYFDAASDDTITITGVIVPPASSGIFQYTATKETILLLKYGKNVYTRYLVNQAGTVVNVVSGDFTVMPSVL